MAVSVNLFKIIFITVMQNQIVIFICFIVLNSK